MLPCYEWGCWPRCYEWGCWPRCCDWYWCWGLWRNSTRDSSLCYCLLFFTHQSQRKPCHKRFLITLCYRAGFFTNDEYNRANYDDNLELKPGCYPQEHHSKRGCIVPIRKQREVVLDTCPGSRVILMDLCNGVPQTKQSPNCSPKAGKVLSTEQVEQGLKHIYHTVADIARENSSHLPMLASSIKAVNNTFCRRLSCADAVTLVNRYSNEQNFQTSASKNVGTGCPEHCER